VRTARLYPVGEEADHAEKKKLFEQDKLSIHIYALSPTPVKVCHCSSSRYPADNLGSWTVPHL
jgi:hypothetical protein